MTNGKKPTIVYNYKKAVDYRTYHMDGVFGGATPNANINFSVFVEKALVPDKTFFELQNDKTLKEVKRIPDEDNEVIRELQANFVMNIETAKVVRNWITRQIKVIEDNMEEVKK